MTRLGVAAALVGDALLPGDVEFGDGRILAVGLSPAGPAGIAAPGLVDLQVNGYAGVDVATAGKDELDTMRTALARDGVTSFAPTVITGEPDATVAAVERLTAAAEVSAGRARLLGIHLEGPWLSPERIGTHPARFRRDPSPAETDRLVTDRVVLVTLAPERPGALDVVRSLTARGVRVLLGHSDATAAQAHAAFAAGAVGTTHLFNAMAPLRTREAGLVGAALTRPGVVNGLIADGHHVSPDVIRLCFAAAPGRIALVTDATAAARMPDGRYCLGDVDVELAGGAVRNGTGGLAGSAATLAGCVRHAVSLGIDPATALAAASTVPARLLGRAELGELRPGGPADVLVLDDDFEVRTVLLDGQEPS